MCTSTPKMPAPPPPPQEIKQPDTMNTRRQRRGPMPGTLLTGPSGVASGGLNTGGNTLLGG